VGRTGILEVELGGSEALMQASWAFEISRGGGSERIGLRERDKNHATGVNIGTHEQAQPTIPKEGRNFLFELRGTRAVRGIWCDICESDYFDHAKDTCQVHQQNGTPKMVASRKEERLTVSSACTFAHSH